MCESAVCVAITLSLLWLFLSGEDLVPEQEDEAEEDGAGCPGSCLPGKRRLSVDALPRAAGLQTGTLPEVSLCCSSSSRSTGRPTSCLLCPSTQPAVQLPSAQCLHSAPGLFLPVQQPPRSHAALCHNSTCGLLPDLPSVLLTLSFSLKSFSNLHCDILSDKMRLVLFF